MDLVSLETQEENDFFAEYLESSKAAPVYRAANQLD